jgi:hypothetical protein
MMSLKPLERLVAFADRGRAKVVLLADSLRLHAQQVDSPMRDVISQISPLSSEHSP